MKKTTISFIAAISLFFGQINVSKSQTPSSYVPADHCYTTWLNAWDQANDDHFIALGLCPGPISSVANQTCSNAADDALDLALWNAGNDYIQCVQER